MLFRGGLNLKSFREGAKGFWVFMRAKSLPVMIDRFGIWLVGMMCFSFLDLSFQSLRLAISPMTALIFYFERLTVGFDVVCESKERLFVFINVEFDWLVSEFLLCLWELLEFAVVFAPVCEFYKWSKMFFDGWTLYLKFLALSLRNRQETPARLGIVTEFRVIPKER
jgi:hypothetical protein